MLLAALSLARFQCGLREGHMAAVVNAFGCLKKYPKQGITIDADELSHIENAVKLKLDFGHQHCEFEEELDSRFPAPLMDEIGTTMFVDSNLGHDKATGESITGLIGLLGNTPINWYAKRQ